MAFFISIYIYFFLIKKNYSYKLQIRKPQHFLHFVQCTYKISATLFAIYLHTHIPLHNLFLKRDKHVFVAIFRKYECNFATVFRIEFPLSVYTHTQRGRRIFKGVRGEKRCIRFR